MPHQFPELGYGYDALEPYIDARTMEIHHSKHHAAYVAKLNEAIEKYPDLQSKPVEELVRHLDQVPSDIRTAVRNHGGGHLNHTFFWSLLKPKVEFKGEIAEAITARFGSFNSFKDQLVATGVGVFGSGWAWLVVNKAGELELKGYPNQDNPTTFGETPVLGIDVWEHAYYLRYKNVRPEYLKAIMAVLNWEVINENYLLTRQTAKRAQ